MEKVKKASKTFTRSCKPTWDEFFAFSLKSPAFAVLKVTQISFVTSAGVPGGQLEGRQLACTRVPSCSLQHLATPIPYWAGDGAGPQHLLDTLQNRGAQGLCEERQGGGGEVLPAHLAHAPEPKREHCRTGRRVKRERMGKELGWVGCKGWSLGSLLEP